MGREHPQGLYLSSSEHLVLTKATAGGHGASGDVLKKPVWNFTGGYPTLCPLVASGDEDTGITLSSSSHPPSQLPYLPPERSLVDRNRLPCSLVQGVMRWHLSFFPPHCPSMRRAVIFTPKGVVQQAGCSLPWSLPLGADTPSG